MDTNRTAQPSPKAGLIYNQLNNTQVTVATTDANSETAKQPEQK